AERLPREGRAPRLLVGALTDLKGPVAPRAVARDTTREKAVRADRRQHERSHTERRPGDHETRESPVADVRGRWRHRPRVESVGDADLLRDRSGGCDPLQMGRRRRRGGARGRARHADPGSNRRESPGTQIARRALANPWAGPGERPPRRTVRRW